MKNAFYIIFLLFISENYLYAKDIKVNSFKIKTIRSSDNTNITYFKPNNRIKLVNKSCTHIDFYAIKIKPDAFSQIYTLLFKAASSNMNITAWISTEPKDCLNGRQRISLTEINF